MISKDPVLRGSSDPSVRSRSGLRPKHFATAAVTVVVVAVVAYLVIHAIAGILGFLVDVAIILGLLYLAVRLLTRRRRS